ncbi:MAG: class I SAM-dependent methyltransferase [Candidatus Eremiobacteraeota bacterium]|nr:class I SAM-dependent methyltransferase [Candidatus Eremiobacteraeota bacterium]
MYTQSAKYYDALYRAVGKNYADESEQIRAILTKKLRSGGNSLLDVGCGTGLHVQHLQRDFTCEGVDIERNLLNLAAERAPQVTFHQADMISFNLFKKFDAIICLFSAIGHVPGAMRLNQTLQTFARHLRPGGVVIVEPWITPERWQDGLVSALYVDEPDLKVARMNVSRRDGNVSILHFHYMIGSTDGIRTFTEPHRLTLFTDQEYAAAFRGAALEVEHDAHGLTGRGLLIGTKPL